MSLLSTLGSFAKSAAPFVQAGADIYGFNQARNAARDSAQAQTQIGQQAASAAEFRPYSVTTGMGTGFFNKDNQTAGYELSPVFQAFRDRNIGMSAGVYDQLGAADPQAFAQQLFAEQQGLLDPQRQAQDIALRNQQLGRGRIGMGLSGEAAGAGMGGMVNPEQFQLQQARAMADAQMAFDAREMGQADIDRLIGRAGGLFQTGAGIEELGMTPLKLGAEFGGRQSQAGAGMAQALLAGGQGAANANFAGGLMRGQAAQNFGQAFGGLFGGR